MHSSLDSGELLRIGKGASFPAFRDAGLESLLRGRESDILRQIDELAQQLRQFDPGEDRALTRNQLTKLRARGSDQSKRVFLDPAVRVVVATAFKAMNFLDDESIRKIIEDGEAPFTTIFIDEAGLISRAAVEI